MFINDTLRKWLGTESQLPSRTFASPLFITGCMRSGTTMLVNKISQHPQLLKVGGELNEIWSEIGGAEIFPGNKYRNESHASMDFSNNMTDYFSRSALDARSVKRMAMRAAYRWKTGGGRVNYDWENLVVVNKSPHLINKTRFLHALFPQSHIVLIVRPMQEQVASLKMHFIKHNLIRVMPSEKRDGWHAPYDGQSSIDGTYPEDFRLLPEMWLRLNECAIEDVSQIPAEQVSIIKYEDMLKRQDEVLEKLFNNLNLLPRHKPVAEKISQSGIKVFNTSTKGKPEEKWKKHLSEEEKAVLEDFTTNESIRISKLTEVINSQAL